MSMTRTCHPCRCTSSPGFQGQPAHMGATAAAPFLAASEVSQQNGFAAYNAWTSRRRSGLLVRAPAWVLRPIALTAASLHARRTEV